MNLYQQIASKSNFKMFLSKIGCHQGNTFTMTTTKKWKKESKYIDVRFLPKKGYKKDGEKNK